MRVKHGTKVKLQYKSGRKIIETHIVPVEHIEADMTVFAAIHGGVSGQVNWNELESLFQPPKLLFVC